jgi:hypothetical protein
MVTEDIVSGDRLEFYNNWDVFSRGPQISDSGEIANTLEAKRAAKPARAKQASSPTSPTQSARRAPKCVGLDTTPKADGSPLRPRHPVR